MTMIRVLAPSIVHIRVLCCTWTLLCFIIAVDV